MLELSGSEWYVGLFLLVGVATYGWLLWEAVKIDVLSDRQVPQRPRSRSNRLETYSAVLKEPQPSGVPSKARQAGK